MAARSPYLDERAMEIAAAQLRLVSDHRLGQQMSERARP